MCSNVFGLADVGVGSMSLSILWIRFSMIRRRDCLCR
jgi:hypothetical protein